MYGIEFSNIIIMFIRRMRSRKLNAYLSVICVVFLIGATVMTTQLSSLALPQSRISFDNANSFASIIDVDCIHKNLKNFAKNECEFSTTPSDAGATCDSAPDDSILPISFKSHKNIPVEEYRFISDSTSFDYQEIFDKLDRLSNGAAAAGDKAFQGAINQFIIDLSERLQGAGSSLPDYLKITMDALSLWANDPGNLWGRYFSPSAKGTNIGVPEYATAPARQFKCNIFVAKVLYDSLGEVCKAIPSAEEKGKFFPYQASQWGDSGTNIKDWSITIGEPRIGDIWSNGHHVGIFLGNYNDISLYISARDRLIPDTVGSESGVEFKTGINIKQLDPGGVFRRYFPISTPDPTGKCIYSK